jgi:hypothetical protein
MVAVVTATVLLRTAGEWRSCKPPLAVVWLAWFAIIGHGESRSTTPSFFVRFITIGVATTFARLGQVPGAAWHSSRCSSSVSAWRYAATSCSVRTASERLRSPCSPERSSSSPSRRHRGRSR